MQQANNTIYRGFVGGQPMYLHPAAGTYTGQLQNYGYALRQLLAHGGHALAGHRNWQLAGVHSTNIGGTWQVATLTLVPCYPNGNGAPVTVRITHGLYAPQLAWA